MKRIFFTVLAGVLAALLCAATAWVGGFDFDKRSPDIALMFMLALILVYLAGLITWWNSEKTE